MNHVEYSSPTCRIYFREDYVVVSNKDHSAQGPKNENEDTSVSLADVMEAFGVSNGYLIRRETVPTQSHRPILTLHHETIFDFSHDYELVAIPERECVQSNSNNPLEEKRSFQVKDNRSYLEELGLPDQFFDENDETVVVDEALRDLHDDISGHECSESTFYSHFESLSTTNDLQSIFDITVKRSRDWTHAKQRAALDLLQIMYDPSLSAPVDFSHDYTYGEYNPHDMDGTLGTSVGTLIVIPSSHNMRPGAPYSITTQKRSLRRYQLWCLLRTSDSLAPRKLKRPRQSTEEWKLEEEDLQKVFEPLWSQRTGPYIPLLYPGYSEHCVREES